MRRLKRKLKESIFFCVLCDKCTDKAIEENLFPGTEKRISFSFYDTILVSISGEMLELGIPSITHEKINGSSHTILRSNFVQKSFQIDYILRS